MPAGDDAIRASWQGRVLALARGPMMFVVPSMLAHVYDDDMPFFLNAVRPTCWNTDVWPPTLIAPFLSSIGRINYGGQIEAETIFPNGAVAYRVYFFNSRDYESQLRWLADQAKLTDNERIEFFVVARKWVGSDMRRDPTMDPRDPDAKRIHH